MWQQLLGRKIFNSIWRRTSKIYFCILSFWKRYTIFSWHVNSLLIVGKDFWVLLLSILIKIFHVSFSKHCEANISDFINLISTANHSGRFSFLKYIQISNDKNNHFNAHKTWGYQIWTVNTSRGAEQLETY